MPRRLHPVHGFAPDFVAERLDEAMALPGPVRIYGLAGLQGCGKSTLARQMQQLAAGRGVAVEVLSIDDFYFGRRKRQALARRVHPLLATRGPPGSHDLALALATLDALRAGERPPLPRFDKGLDTRLAPSRWRRPAKSPALVVLEGWFLKTPPQPEADLAGPINTIERDEDPDGRWRRHCNQSLARYSALWHRLDWLTVLQAPGFAPVAGWRWQQEREGPARRRARHALDRDGVARFVMLFERVSQQSLATLPMLADRVVRLDAQRRPVR